MRQRTTALITATVLGLVASIGMISEVSAARAKPVAAALIPVDASATTASVGPSTISSQPVEVPSLRTRTSRTYRVNGHPQAQIYSGSLNYQDSSGAWQPIDNSLTSTTVGGYAYTNRANRYSASFPNRLTDAPIRLASGSSWIQFAPTAPSGTTVTVIGGTASYTGAYPGVTLAWTAINDGVEEKVTLQGPASPSTFTYTLAMSSDVSAQTSGGGVDFLSGGQRLFSFSAPFMYDSSGGGAGFSRAVSLALAGSTLTLSADPTWLASPSRVWPVTIDPTVTYNGDQNCDIANSSLADTNLCSGATLDVGYDGSNVYRALLQFNVSGVLPPSSTVLDAQLNLFQESSSTTSYQNVSAYALSESWTNSVTWNKRDGIAAWQTTGGTFGATPLGTTYLDATTGYRKWKGMIPSVQGWIDKPSGNYGVILKSAGETTVEKYSFDSTRAAANPPFVSVDYVPALGVQAFYELEKHRLTDRMDLVTNVVNGNLVVHNADLDVQGTGLNLALDRYFNNLSNIQGAPGAGWTFGTGKDVDLYFPASGDSVVFFAPTGYAATFLAAGGGSFTSPPGIDADLTYLSGSYTLTYHQSKEKLSFNSSGVLQSDTDRNGNAISFFYNANGTLNYLTDTQGRRVNFSYTSPVDPTVVSSMTITTPNLGTRIYSYSYALENGYVNLKTYTDPNNKQTQYTFDAASNLQQISDPLSQQTRFTYDISGRVKTIKYVTNNATGDGFTATYNYGQPTSACGTPPAGGSFAGRTDLVDANGHTTKYCFNPQGLVTAVLDGLGHERQTGYTTDLNVASLTDALSQVDTLSYDLLNNLIQVQSPASAGGQTAASRYFGFPSSGLIYQPNSVTDAQNNCRALSYDTAGNLQDVYDGLTPDAQHHCGGQIGGTHLSNAYQGDPGVPNCNGKPGELCSTTDGNGNTTTYSYDGLTTGNLVSITPPQITGGIGATSIVPDDLSRVSCVTDGKGQRTHYIYDSLDRIQFIYYGASSCTATSTTSIQFIWDDDGNLTSRIDNTGTTSFAYDKLNRLIDKSLPDTSVACTGSSPLGITFGYDGVGNLTSYCDVGGSLAYGYDRANRLTALAEPGGSINPGTSTTDATCNTNPCTGFQYSNTNLRSEIDYPGGAKWFATYDNARNLLTAIGKDSAQNVKSSFTYTYNQGANDRQLRQSMAQAAPFLSTAVFYSYDQFNHLCAVYSSASGCSIGDRYTYDAGGNRTSATVGGATTYYAYNADNELCWSASSAGSCASPPLGATRYGYDANGNLTSSTPGLGSLSYNVKDQTTAITWNGTTLSPLSYADVGQAERSQAGSLNQYSSPLGLVIDKSGAGATYYTRDNQGNVLGERTPDGNRWYYLKDGLGSVVVVINDSGSMVGDTYAYDAWGNQTQHTGTVANPWGYASGYRDTTGLIKFGTRYYDPNLGRWTQQDPIMGTIALPGTLNRYAYVACNPVNSIDPNGTWCQRLADEAQFFLQLSQYFLSLYRIFWWTQWGPSFSQLALGYWELYLYFSFWAWVSYC